MNNAILKKVVKFGSGGHITLPKKYLGKKVIIVPEEGKIILNRVLQQYNEAINDIIDPTLENTMEKEELQTIAKVTKTKIEEIKKYRAKQIKQKLLKKEYQYPKGIREELEKQYLRYLGAQ